MNTNNITPVVEQISKLNFTGNIIPHNWIKHVLKKTKKPDMYAIFILSDIVYWYRATEKRDEKTGNVISMTKKFKADKLQKYYKDYAEYLGVCDRTVKRSMDLLVELNLVTREFRTIYTKNGPQSNVPFWEPVPERIKEITYTKVTQTSDNDDKVVTSLPDKVVRTLPDKVVRTYTENTYTKNTYKDLNNNNIEEPLENSKRGFNSEEEYSELGKTNNGDGSPLELVSDNTKVSSDLVSTLLEKMKVYNESEREEFRKQLLEYDVEFIQPVLLSILHQHEHGYISTYTPVYIVNAIEYYLDDCDRRGIDMPKTVYTRLKKFCIKFFGEGQDALDVHTFYRDVLSSKQERGETYTSLKKRQEKNIEMLVTTYGRERFLKLLKQFKAGIDEGILYNPTIAHFTNYVKSWSKTKETPTPVQIMQNANNKSEEKNTTIPVPHERVGDVDHPKGEYPPQFEEHNWTFLCECGAVVYAIDKTCPTCLSKFLWEHVEVPDKSRQEKDTDEQREAAV